MRAHSEAICSGRSLCRHTQKDGKRAVLQPCYEPPEVHQRTQSQQHTHSASLSAARSSEVIGLGWHDYFWIDLSKQIKLIWVSLGLVLSQRYIGRYPMTQEKHSLHKTYKMTSTSEDIVLSTGQTVCECTSGLSSQMPPNYCSQRGCLQQSTQITASLQKQQHHGALLSEIKPNKMFFLASH